ncbi:hypothetical protein QBC35DRAFT_491487 [Podospora australis]|uniref:Secreted protein n=1 Tax=Podospora australis TaxID=1536484 RepID=A0AAN6WX79_9PEZI|nr:hypothetical protein QBC35DRAFT_491487 [Podospora australis]
MPALSGWRCPIPCFSLLCLLHLEPAFSMPWKFPIMHNSCNTKKVSWGRGYLQLVQPQLPVFFQTHQGHLSRISFWLSPARQDVGGGMFGDHPGPGHCSSHLRCDG